MCSSHCITSFLGPSGDLPVFQDRLCSERSTARWKSWAKVSGQSSATPSGSGGCKSPRSGPFPSHLVPRRWAPCKGWPRAWVTGRLCPCGESRRPCISLQQVGEACERASRPPPPALPGTGASRSRARGAGRGAGQGVWRARVVLGACPEAQPASATFPSDRSSSCGRRERGRPNPPVCSREEERLAEGGESDGAAGAGVSVGEPAGVSAGAGSRPPAPREGWDCCTLSPGRPGSLQPCRSRPSPGDRAGAQPASRRAWAQRAGRRRSLGSPRCLEPERGRETR